MKEITDKEFRTIRDYIKQNFGIALSDEKKSLIYSRLRTTLLDNGFTNFTDYFDHLISDKTGDAIVRFIDKVTTNHTYFMRESDHFYYLRDTALPFIKEKWGADRDLRLWCAASSSGEEPTTLAIIAHDFFKNEPAKWDTTILATDISSQILDKAVFGVYANEAIEPMPAEWKKNYFKPYDNNHSVVTDEIKKKILYRKFNLMSPRFSFKKKLHIIFCRNVMIYFDNKTRDEIVQKFYDIIEPEGFLFIGHSESLNHTGTAFKYVMPALYRKI